MQLMLLPKRRERKFRRICIEHLFQNCSRIYPIQQQKVSRIVEHLQIKMQMESVL